MSHDAWTFCTALAPVLVAALLAPIVVPRFTKRLEAAVGEQVKQQVGEQIDEKVSPKLDESHRMLTMNGHESAQQGLQPTILDALSDIKAEQIADRQWRESIDIRLAEGEHRFDRIEGAIGLPRWQP